MRKRHQAQPEEKALAGTIDISNRVQKFVDCRTKDISAPGDSILWRAIRRMGAVQACRRRGVSGASCPVRGKILNCLKADYDKIFKSEIITDLIKVLGCGVEVSEQGATRTCFRRFDLDQLRWNKVVSSVPTPTWTASRSAP